MRYTQLSMHELPIVESVLKKVLSRAKENKFKRVTQVDLVIGEFTGFVDESVEFYWEIISKGTVAEEAVIKIKRLAGTFECLKCNAQIVRTEVIDLCPNCGSFKLRIVGGDDLLLSGIIGE